MKSNKKSTKKLTIDDFKTRSNEIHNDFYDYSKTEYINATSKVKIICPIHGIFKQRPSDHLRGCGCKQCSLYKTNRLKPYSEFISNANMIHQHKYEYVESDYVDSKTKIRIICPIHGIFKQSPYSHMIGRGCPECGLFKNKNKKTTEQFIKNSKAIHGEKYDYSEVYYIGNKHKVKIICPTHGEFFQTPNAHLRNGGCRKCGILKRTDGKKLGTSNFISQASKIHNNEYDYIPINYINSYQKMPIICKSHGVFFQNVGNHLAGCRCPKCASYVSKSENGIKKILDDLQIDYIQMDRTVISPLELDFVIPSKKVAIEFNGIYYHSENSGGKDSNYHLNKTTLCEMAGYRLIHIFESEYSEKYPILKSKITSIMGSNKYKIFARKCEIMEISHLCKKRFNEKYHIQGDAQSCINIGLFYKRRLVQVMTFSKRRKALGSKHRDGEYELIRMSSIKGFTIIGGATRLLSFFEKTYNPMKIISYADRRWSNGNVYHKMGFKLIRTTPPNYWYFHKNKYKKRLYHRYKFAKHTLNTQLTSFDPNMTEWENMKSNGYDRIWDCGNLYYEKTYI